MGGPRQGSSRLRALAGIVALSGVLVGVAPAPVSAASSLAPTTTHHVTPQEKEFPGDRACPVGTTLVKDQFQSVTQGVETGTASRSYDIGGTTVTVTLTVHADNTFDFAIDNGVAAHVFVKGSNYLLYQYAPPVAGATNSGAVSSDTGLHSGYISGDSYQDVSHLDFCLSAVRPPVALQATTTATATFTRTITWSLDKSVTPASHAGAAGEDAGTSTWTVVASKIQTLSNFQVTGTVSVTNGNNFPVAFAVAESLTGGIPVTVNCAGSVTPNEGTAPANGSVNCTYAVTPANDLATLVTAVVTPTDSAIGAVTATAPVSFTENVIGDDTVTVDDNRDSEGQFPDGISTSTTFDYDETFPCSSNPADYTNGVDVDTYPNTATLTGDNTNLSDSATVTVTCSLAPVTATKTAAGTYDRTIEWTLEKSVAPTSHSGTAGNAAGTSTWTVVATKTETLGNYRVTGSITIDNPTGVPQSFTVTDVLNDGTVAAVDCDATTAGNQSFGTLPADGAMTCQYTALPEDDSATLNTATVSVSGNPDQTATVAVSFTENVIGDDTVTVDDDRDTEGQFPKAISSSTTFDYDETFRCSGISSDYTNFTNQRTETNTATLTGPDTDLSDSAAVDITCTLPAASVDVTKTVAGNAVMWSFDFTIAPVPAGETATKSATNAAPTVGWDGLVPGTSYTITETNVAGFITGTLTCTGGTNTVGASSFTPAAGQAVTCAITNDVVEQQAPPIADIAVVKTATPTVVTPGGNVTWTLVATNNGPNPADNATIVDSLPAALTLVSFTAPAGWDCSGSVTGNPGKLSCTKPTMGVNESGTFTLSTTVAAAAAGTTINNIAVVSTTTTETTTSNNQDPEPITVQIAVLPPTGGYVWNRVAIAAGLVFAGFALAAVDRRRRLTS